MMHADRLSYGIPEPRGNSLAAIWFRSTGLAVAVIATIVLSPFQDARAEVDEIRLARPFGIAFLQMGLMDHLQLIQKHAEKAGIELEVEWRRFSSGTAMNEALISGNLGRGKWFTDSVQCHLGQDRRALCWLVCHDIHAGSPDDTPQRHQLGAGPQRLRSHRGRRTIRIAIRRLENVRG